MTDRADARPSLTVGTAGHIDHGKTALVRALTGRDTDRLAEEQRRGMSIELGYAELDLDGRRLSLIDVPGHERFVRTMIAGASGIDLFLLVVAADDGVMPQTREHLAVLEALGVSDGVVAVTKVDLADALRLEEVEREVADLTPEVEIVRASSRTGEGIDTLRSSLGRLAERVDSRREAEGGEGGGEEVVLHVDRVFSVAGHGTIATGTLWSGTVRRGDRVLLLPSGKEARVRSIESHDRSLELVGPRRRVALNLAGLGRDEVRRGDVVTQAGRDDPRDPRNATGRGRESVGPTQEPGGGGDESVGPTQEPGGGGRESVRPTREAGRADPGVVRPTQEPGPAEPGAIRPMRQARRVGRSSIRPTYRLDVQLAPGAQAVLGERRVQVHHGTRESPARVVDLGEGAVQLRLEQPLLARGGDQVVIRRIAPPDTLGGAVIIDPSPRRHSHRSEISVSTSGCSAPKTRHASEPVARAEPSALAGRVLAELEGDGDRPRTPARLAEDMALERREVERAVGELVDTRAAVRFKADVVYPTPTAARLSDAAAALAVANGSTSIGEVRDALGLSRKYAQALLEHLDGERVLRRDGDRHVPRGVAK